MTYFVFPSDKDNDQINLDAVLHAVRGFADELQLPICWQQLAVLVRLDERALQIASQFVANRKQQRGRTPNMRD